MTTAFTHTTTVALPAPPARVFTALTAPDELRAWFAEHVEVEPRDGGAYRFWGRHTLGAPGPTAAQQRITAWVPGERLGFSWTMDGAPTSVTYTLAPDDKTGGTQLTVAHAVEGALRFRQAEHAVSDLWRIHTGNLQDHLAQTTAVVLPDFATDRPEVRASIEIAAPPARVFKALLDPDTMNQWLGGAAQVDVATGQYSYGWRYEVEGRSVVGGPTRILELVENQRLVTDWGDWRGDPDKPDNRITWLLEPLADGQHTRLTVVHDGFEHAVDRSDYHQGWGGFLLAIAKVTTASAPALP